LSLAVLPEAQISEWIRIVAEASFSGVVNLEVFSPADLEASRDMLMGLLSSGLSGSTFRVPG